MIFGMTKNGVKLMMDMARLKTSSPGVLFRSRTARKGVITMTENDAIKLLNASYIVDGAGDVDRRRIKLEEFLISALKEIQQYREIGTVEECYRAVLKQKPTKPEIYTDTMQTMNGSFQRDVFECSVCGEYICNVEEEK